jgi:His-Xaa-Ser system protein HxsD
MTGELPDDLLTLDRGERSIGLRVEVASYPLSAIYGAAYVFLDRCWVLLDRPDAQHVRVTLTARSASTGGASLEALAGEFAEELVSSAWRAGIEADTRSLIEGAIARAHSGGDAPPSLDELSSFEFAGDAGGAMDDPLGIAMSWEEKHKKKEA